MFHILEGTSDSELNDASDLSLSKELLLLRQARVEGISHNRCRTNIRQDCSLMEALAFLGSSAALLRVPDAVADPSLILCE